MNQVAASSRPYNVLGLMPWVTRTEPISRELKTVALREPYEVARKNINRADAIITTIALAFYAVRVQRGEAPAEVSSMNEALKIGLAEWEHIGQTVPHFGIPQGFEGVLLAYLVQAHTAFETFAGDLWEAAVNIHPQVLAELKGSKSPQDSKTIKLDVLQRHGYDLTGKMGTILRDGGKVQFDSLRGIREAYSLAFGADCDAIIKPLQHESLTITAALRNVIVHRAGIADADYVNQTNGKALAPQASRGESVFIDGGTLSNLLGAAYPHVIAMFEAVDDWLASH